MGAQLHHRHNGCCSHDGLTAELVERTPTWQALENTPVEADGAANCGQADLQDAAEEENKLTNP